MQYTEVAEARFVSRENRFVATVVLNQEQIRVHVKNTGRCQELLRPNARVFLADSKNPKRKYRYDLIAVEKGNLLINMDSQAPNQAFNEFLRSGGLVNDVSFIKPEYQYGSSRIDFYFERGMERHLVEIKGVTLEEHGICQFPDAPTERGTKHLHELIKATEEGYHAWICFVVQMQGMRWLEPNERTDPAFAQALRDAADAGVRVCAFQCNVGPAHMEITSEIPVRLFMQ